MIDGPTSSQPNAATVIVMNTEGIMHTDVVELLNTIFDRV